MAAAAMQSPPLGLAPAHGHAAPMSASSSSSSVAAAVGSGSGASGTKRRQDSAQLHAQHMADEDDQENHEQGETRGAIRGAAASWGLDDAQSLQQQAAGALLVPTAAAATHTRSRSKRLSRATNSAGPDEARYSGMEDMDAAVPPMQQAPLQSSGPIKTSHFLLGTRMPLQDISNLSKLNVAGSVTANGIRSGDKRILPHVHMRSHSAMLHSSGDKKLARLAASFQPVAPGPHPMQAARGEGRLAAVAPAHLTLEELAADEAADSSMLSACVDEHDQDDALNASIESTSSACSSLGVHALRIQHDASYSSAATSFAHSSSSLSMSMQSAVDCGAFSAASASSSSSLHGASFSITQQVAELDACSSSPSESVAHHHQLDDSSSVVRSGGAPVALKSLDTPSVLPSGASTLTVTMAHSLQLEDKHPNAHSAAHQAHARTAASAAQSAAAAAAAAVPTATATEITIHPVAYTHPDMHTQGEEANQSSKQAEAAAASAVPAPVQAALDPAAAAAASTALVSATPSSSRGGDPACMEYSSEIWYVLRSSELKYLPNPSYMEEVQSDLSHLMRTILCDWLIEVAEEYTLESQTLFLCVAYVDRFLSRHPVDRAKLQLLGVAAMLLASKYWEIRAPTVEDLIYISDRTYSREQVLAMESVLLDTMGFALMQVTPWDCSSRLAAEMGREVMSERTEFLVELMMELFILDPAYLHYRPSVIAVSAIFLALYTTHQNPWPPCLELSSGMDVESIQLCVRSMHASYLRMCQQPGGLLAGPGVPPLLAIRDKYSSEARGAVANIQPRLL